MKGKALAAFLSLTAAAGCATPGRPSTARKLMEPVGYSPIPPIAATINGGLASADPAAVRAGLAEGGFGPRPRLIAEPNQPRASTADPAVSTVADGGAPPKMPATAETEPTSKPKVVAEEPEIPPLPDLAGLPSQDAPPSSKAIAAETPPAEPALPPLPESKPAEPASTEPSLPPLPESKPAEPASTEPSLPPLPESKPAEPASTEPSLPPLPESSPNLSPNPIDETKPPRSEAEGDQSMSDPPRDRGLRRVAATEEDHPIAPADLKKGEARLDGETTRLRETKIDVPVRAPLSLTAATVGDTVITEQELVNAFRQWRSMLSTADQAEMPEDFKNAKMESMLDEMIEQTILYQTAKHRVNNEKTWRMIQGQVDQDWRDRELPRLLRKWSADNEYSLAKKMADAGIDYDQIKDYYHREVLGYQFLGQSIQSKLKVDPPEVKRYYESHKTRFDRPARVTWREILIDARNHADRASALRKAQQALARLRRGEEFAKVAIELSEGPNAAKGGLWADSTPGDYSVGVVNDAIARTPLNRISSILESDFGFHIVRVEDRRAAGPASFPEVENEIRELLRKQKQKKAWEEAIAKMKSKIVVEKRFRGASALEIDPLSVPSAKSEAAPRESTTEPKADPDPRG